MISLRKSEKVEGKREGGRRKEERGKWDREEERERID